MMRRLLVLLAAAVALAGLPGAADAASPGVRINAGGGAFTTFAGDQFGADSAFTGGSTYSTTQPINTPTDGALYQDERWGQFSYAIPVANGTYDVRFHFVEIYYGTAQPGGSGKRLFGMDVLDTPASPDLANIDVYAEVGARKPLIKTVGGVTVTDGKLDVRSVYGASDDPEVAAIEVIPSGPVAPPTVTAPSPADGATGVAAGAKPSATFSRAMNPATLTSATFTLTRDDGTPITASVAYDATALKATLTPASALSYSTTYTARLGTGVTAADGTALAAPVAWTFTTGAAPPPDNQPPTVSVTAPANGATVSGAVTLTANAADNVGVEGVQFQVDGADFGSEDTSAPYSHSWSTFGLSGPHTITAIARDAAGNRTTTAPVAVTVTNPAVDPTGLVGAWGFEEGTGTTAVDSSGKANNGTLSGAQWTDGRFGGALDFDGSSARVNIPDATSLDLSTAMTLEAWVRPSFAGGWRTAIMKEKSGGMAYSLYGSAFSDRPSAHITTGSEQDTRGTAVLPTNSWTHLAATWDGSNLRLYVDGNQVSSTTVGGSIANSALPLRFGGNAIWGEYFKGSLDEIRIYNRALSAAEVKTDLQTPVKSD